MEGLNPISEARDAFSKCEDFLQSRGALAYMAPRLPPILAPGVGFEIFLHREKAESFRETMLFNNL